jgi:hypothetical protein
MVRGLMEWSIESGLLKMRMMALSFSWINRAQDRLNRAETLQELEKTKAVGAASALFECAAELTAELCKSPREKRVRKPRRNAPQTSS